MYHKLVIERFPLQTYVAAILFTPEHSTIKNLYAHEKPKQIKIVSPVPDRWNTCLQTLEGHSSWVYSIVFSHDLTQLASASEDHTIKVWDASSGACLKTLEGHGDLVRSVVFSHDSTRLASASADRTIKVWDASSGACLQTLEGHKD
jgi:WD40 repeat protein